MWFNPVKKASENILSEALFFEKFI